MTPEKRATTHSSGKGGRRADLGGLYVRSSWEANYCRYLNWLVEQGEIQSWEYEPDTFEFHKIKRGTRFYTPDFKIIEADGSIEYHEIKGWMTPVSKTKLRRMKKYYPGVKVVVIGAVEYKALSRDLKKLISGWELSARKGY